MRPSVCPRCYQEEEGMFTVHERCAAALKLYCPIPSGRGEISFDDVLESAILARPLVRPARNTPRYLSQHLQAMYTPFQNQLLPFDVIRHICDYLEPFPELVAITYAISTAVRYAKRRRPGWTEINTLKAGMTLYLSYGSFEGCTYLTNVGISPSGQRSKALPIRDQVFVCRDHFAIQDIYTTSVEPSSGVMGTHPVYHHTIDLAKPGTKELNVRGFSDVGAIIPRSSLANSHRDCSSEPSSLWILPFIALNGIPRALLYKGTFVGSGTGTTCNVPSLDASTIILAVLLVSLR